jgi:ribosomal protein L16 Arg81 hydroxylase
MTVEVPDLPLATGALQRLIDPVSRDDFLTGYWEKQPLFVSRGNSRYFDGLFSLDEFDALLARGDLWHPNLRVFLAGEQLPPGQFCTTWRYGREAHDRLVDRGKLLDLLRQGATLNLLGVERTCSHVSLLSRRLEQESGFPVHTTAFFTPPNAVNIPPHYDMVDVFVVQVSGTKEWGLWRPDRALPLTTDTGGRIYQRGDDRTAPARALGRHVLQPGDTLYVPRGVLHEAVTTDQASLHLAVGVNVHRWYDVIRAVAEQAVAGLADRVEFRRALPVGYHRGDHTPDSTPSSMAAALASTVLDGLDSGLAALDERFLRSRSASRPGHLVDVDHLDHLNLASRLVVRPGVVVGVGSHNGRVRVTFHQKSLTLGPDLGTALTFVTSGQSFTIAEIPGLADAQRLRFGRRLVSEGLLTVVPESST